MYGTTDLATVVDRRSSVGPDLSLYVVDQRQADHFEQVFRAAALAGYAGEGDVGAYRLRHHERGSTASPSRLARAGVMKLHDLIGMATAKARDRLREADLGGELDAAEEFEATAHKVAVAALKFADLSNYRGASYVFDLDRFTSFEGRTGPYLLYQAVRIKSLLRRADAQGAQAGAIIVEAPAERDLALALDAFDAAVQEAYDRRAPNALAEHAYRLAQTFSRFYAACPVLAADDEAARGSRLALSAASLKQLACALSLLGIDTPERM